MEEHGLTPAALETQLKNFREGFPFLPVTRAASCGDGIRVLDAAGIEQAAARYDRAKESLRVVKFVPASGAATRMFKDLFEFVREGRRTAVVGELLANRRRFAFWPELRTIIGDDADELRTVENIVAEGLRYGETPKGLVSFHRYGDEVRKAVEEHLVEGAQYAAAGGEVKIHFTVSPEHLTRFEALLAEKIPGYESRFGVKYRISFSVQDPSTDTLAVNPDCTPFRRADGRLLFRPAGHGALIGNLGKIDADIVFVKNIDNVTTDARRSDTVLYKKALAGVLLALQERIFEYLMALEVPGAELEPIAAFIENELCVKLPKDYGTALLRQVLDRPIRVCGMVRNEGEPGGGPLLGGWGRRAGDAPDRRIEPDRSRKAGVDALGDSFQSGGSGLQLPHLERRSFRSAGVRRSRYGFYLPQVGRGPRAARAGTARSLERCHGPVEYGLRRSPHHDFFARKGSHRSAASRTSGR